MDSSIKQIFKTNIQLLNQAEKAVYYFRIQNYDAALRHTTGILINMEATLDLLVDNTEYFNKNESVLNILVLTDIIRELLDAQEDKDYILLADLYDLKVIPLFYKLQVIILADGETLQDNNYAMNLDIINGTDPQLAGLLETLPGQQEILEQGYFIEPTSSGLMTLAVSVNNKKQYLHSNHNPSFEAFQLVDSWHRCGKNEYIVYGLGLGYHIMELGKIEDSVSIEIFESDLNIIKIACIYGDLSFLSANPRITLCFDSDFTKLSQRISNIENNTGFFLHYPSLRNISVDTIRERLENYFIQNSAVINQRYILNANFESNVCHFDLPVDVLGDKFAGKDLFIVAAGPSLDHNFMQLNNLKENSIILATGTVFRKLMVAGITPDYVIITDPNARVYGQVAGLENSDVPMLCLSTAYHGFTKWYKGRKYLVCQQGYPKAEEYAKEKDLHLFSTGGSVSTTALDIGITYDCRRIIFLGLDLAYTDSFAHATETSQRNAIEFQDMRQVEDIHGNMIPTSRTLDMYKEWIEKRIKGIDNIEFIDATEGGARIKGMRVAKLADVIRGPN